MTRLDALRRMVEAVRTGTDDPEARALLSQRPANRIRITEDEMADYDEQERDEREWR